MTTHKRVTQRWNEVPGTDVEAAYGNAHSSAGWFYVDDQRNDYVGPFPTREECDAAATAVSDAYEANAKRTVTVTATFSALDAAEIIVKEVARRLSEGRSVRHKAAEAADREVQRLARARFPVVEVGALLAVNGHKLTEGELAQLYVDDCDGRIRVTLHVGKDFSYSMFSSDAALHDAYERAQVLRTKCSDSGLLWDIDVAVKKVAYLSTSEGSALVAEMRAVAKAVSARVPADGREPNEEEL